MNTQMMIMMMMRKSEESDRVGYASVFHFDFVSVCVHVCVSATHPLYRAIVPFVGHMHTQGLHTCINRR